MELKNIKDTKQLNEELDGLSELLKTVVDEGASLGFFTSSSARTSTNILANSLSTRRHFVYCQNQSNSGRQYSIAFNDKAEWTSSS